MAGIATKSMPNDSMILQYSIGTSGREWMEREIYSDLFRDGPAWVAVLLSMYGHEETTSFCYYCYELHINMISVRCRPSRTQVGQSERLGCE